MGDQSCWFFEIKAIGEQITDPIVRKIISKIIKKRFGHTFFWSYTTIKQRTQSWEELKQKIKSLQDYKGKNVEKQFKALEKILNEI